MKKTWTMTALAGLSMAALALVGVSAATASAADLKIGYIVTPRLLAESKLGKESSAKLKAKADTAEKTLQKKMEDVKKLQDDITKRMAVLNDTEKAKLGEEYEKQLRDAKRLKEDAQRDFDKSRGEIENDMMTKFRTVIEKFAKDNGYDLVLDAGTLLYISQKADITTEVIQLADKSI
ncbi:MAG TPA: OmpH family outer membrane protein [Candidatus Limnocylindrales bacterium]|nr:OmpH family outer membrane protein [Candidatus Limnocylindrales bacterium]